MMAIRLEYWGIFGAGWTIDSNTLQNSQLSAADVAAGLAQEKINQTPFNGLTFVDVPADATPTGLTPEVTRIYGNPNAQIKSGTVGVGDGFTELSSVQFRSGDWTFVGNHSLDSLLTDAPVMFAGNFNILQALPSDLGGGGDWNNSAVVTIRPLSLGPNQPPSSVSVSGTFTNSGQVTIGGPLDDGEADSLSVGVLSTVINTTNATNPPVINMQSNTTLSVGFFQGVNTVIDVHGTHDTLVLPGFFASSGVAGTHFIGQEGSATINGFTLGDHIHVRNQLVSGVTFTSDGGLGFIAQILNTSKQVIASLRLVDTIFAPQFIITQDADGKGDDITFGVVLTVPQIIQNAVVAARLDHPTFSEVDIARAALASITQQRIASGATLTTVSNLVSAEYELRNYLAGRLFNPAIVNSSALSLTALQAEFHADPASSVATQWLSNLNTTAFVTSFLAQAATVGPNVPINNSTATLDAINGYLRGTAGQPLNALFDNSALPANIVSTRADPILPTILPFLAGANQNKVFVDSVSGVNTAFFDPNPAPVLQFAVEAGPGITSITIPKQDGVDGDGLSLIIGTKTFLVHAGQPFNVALAGYGSTIYSFQISGLEHDKAAHFVFGLNFATDGVVAFVESPQMQFLHSDTPPKVTKPAPVTMSRDDFRPIGKGLSLNQHMPPVVPAAFHDMSQSLVPVIMPHA
jgi:hypothetical protein